MDRAAATVAQSGAAGDFVTLSSEAREKSAASSPDGDVALALVDAQVAKHEVAANVSVLRVSEKMTDDLLELGNPKKA